MPVEPNWTTRSRRIARTVEVTRRLYRSGESEYLIDGEMCRLRDVHELLMDTGLGAKAYAIIEQGKIGMILSSRPADRRQLIEEAAGITKYKARRRAAELKLEAAQQNLTRLEDIVFEVEKQFGSLKRQSAKARRYKRLRDELRHWEKLLFASRYQESRSGSSRCGLGWQTAASARSAAAAAVADAEADFSRVRISLVEAEAQATARARPCTAANSTSTAGSSRSSSTASRSRSLAARAEEVVKSSRRSSRAGSRDASAGRTPRRRSQAQQDQQLAADELERIEREYADESLRIEGLEGDVEAARSEVFSALNVATTLRHAIQHAEEASQRIAQELGKLFVEDVGAQIEKERLEGDRAATADGLRRAKDAAEASLHAKTARETELATARIELEWKSKSLQARERELAGLSARLSSLTELEKSRAGYTEAARMVLAQANGHVGQQGSVADYLDVDPKYERAVEASLSDLLQHVIVTDARTGRAGLDMIRQENVGRCGFVVLDGAPSAPCRSVLRARPTPGWFLCVPLVRITGDQTRCDCRRMPDGFIVDDLAAALHASESTSAPIATLTGDVVLGRMLVSGGSKDEGRAILGIKREIKDLRDRIAGEEAERDQSVSEVAALETRIAQVSNALVAVNADLHREEKAIIGLEMQLQRSADDLEKVQKKFELLEIERRGAEEQRQGLERRQIEARESIARLEQEQRTADEKLTQAQRRLGDARDSLQALARRAAEAKASYAMLVERTGALNADVSGSRKTTASSKRVSKARGPRWTTSARRSEPQPPRRRDDSTPGRGRRKAGNAPRRGPGG